MSNNKLHIYQSYLNKDTPIYHIGLSDDIVHPDLLDPKRIIKTLSASEFDGVELADVKQKLCRALRSGSMINLIPKYGNEWFNIPIEIIDEAIEKVKNDAIDGIVYNIITKEFEPDE